MQRGAGRDAGPSSHVPVNRGWRRFRPAPNFSAPLTAYCPEPLTQLAPIVYPARGSQGASRPCHAPNSGPRSLPAARASPRSRLSYPFLYRAVHARQTSVAPRAKPGRRTPTSGAPGPGSGRPAYWLRRKCHLCPHHSMPMAVPRALAALAGSAPPPLLSLPSR